MKRNFVVFRADEGKADGKELFKKYDIAATPTEMIVEADGSKIDWHVGYEAPPDAFLAKLEKSAQGIDTYKSLSERYAENASDAATVFKLALKLDGDEAMKKWKEGIALDPDGKSGKFVVPFSKARATYSEYGEFVIAQSALRTNQKLMRAFLDKHPTSDLRGQAYRMLAGIVSTSPETEAMAFFEEYQRAYPEDPAVLSLYLRYIVRSGKNTEKGIELAEKIDFLTRYKSAFYTENQAMADFYLNHGDKLMAEEVYGLGALTNRSRIFANDLVRYADFWASRNANREGSLEAIGTALKIGLDAYSVLSGAAAVYLKMGLEDKALSLIGPEYAKKNWDDPNNLWGYANFWATQERNLDDSLVAAKRIVELKPDEYSSWDVLSQVLYKQKNFNGAIEAGEKAVSLADESTKIYLKRKLGLIRAAAEKNKK